MNRLSYPIYVSPEIDSLSEGQFISTGHRYKKGLSETIAYSHLIGAGMDMLRDDVCVTIDGVRYEPDLVYMDESRGIYLDIEVDEPYSAKGKPTHFCSESGIPKDEKRNRAFCSHGWYVIRFTEEQLFRYPESCARLIAEILVRLGEMDTVPERLSQAPDLDPVPQWSEEEAKRMCVRDYRKTYIGFTPGKHDLLKDCSAIMAIGESMLADVLQNPNAVKAVLTYGNIANLFKYL